MNHVYVLKSEKDGKFYVGCTSDIEKRIAKHESGYVPSTRHRRPLILVYKEEYEDAYEAYRMEKFYKTGTGKKQLIKKLENYSGIV